MPCQKDIEEAFGNLLIGYVGGEAEEPESIMAYWRSHGKRRGCMAAGLPVRIAPSLCLRATYWQISSKTGMDRWRCKLEPVSCLRGRRR